MRRQENQQQRRDHQHHHHPYDPDDKDLTHHHQHHYPKKTEDCHHHHQKDYETTTTTTKVHHHHHQRHLYHHDKDHDDKENNLVVVWEEEPCQSLQQPPPPLQPQDHSNHHHLNRPTYWNLPQKPPPPLHPWENHEYEQDENEEEEGDTWTSTLVSSSMSSSSGSTNTNSTTQSSLVVPPAGWNATTSNDWLSPPPTPLWHQPRQTITHSWPPEQDKDNTKPHSCRMHFQRQAPRPTNVSSSSLPLPPLRILGEPSWRVGRNHPVSPPSVSKQTKLIRRGEATNHHDPTDLSWMVPAQQNDQDQDDTVTNTRIMKKMPDCSFSRWLSTLTFRRWGHLVNGHYRSNHNNKDKTTLSLPQQQQHHNPNTTTTTTTTTARWYHRQPLHASRSVEITKEGRRIKTVPFSLGWWLLLWLGVLMMVVVVIWDGWWLWANGPLSPPALPYDYALPPLQLVQDLTGQSLMGPALFEYIRAAAAQTTSSALSGRRQPRTTSRRRRLLGGNNPDENNDENDNNKYTIYIRTANNNDHSNNDFFGGGSSLSFVLTRMIQEYTKCPRVWTIVVDTGRSTGYNNNNNNNEEEDWWLPSRLWNHPQVRQRRSPEQQGDDHDELGHRPTTTTALLVVTLYHHRRNDYWESRLPTCLDLDRAFAEWQRDPTRLVGFSPLYHPHYYHYHHKNGGGRRRQDGDWDSLSTSFSDKNTNQAAATEPPSYSLVSDQVLFVHSLIWEAFENSQRLAAATAASLSSPQQQRRPVLTAHSKIDDHDAWRPSTAAQVCQEYVLSAQWAALSQQSPTAMMIRIQPASTQQLEQPPSQNHGRPTTPQQQQQEWCYPHLLAATQQTSFPSNTILYTGQPSLSLSSY